MNSMPARSAICASLTQSGQLPDQRSGTVVTARPEEQLAPEQAQLEPVFAAHCCAPAVSSLGVQGHTRRLFFAAIIIR
jgi:hypothetical protein